jgi:hypothetical protein
MGLVTLPFTLSNGTSADADQVMAIIDAITSAVNGGLDSTNVQSGTPVAQTSLGGLSTGTSNVLALSDHQHILQGFEQLSTDPTTGNFQGRIYWDTTNNRLRGCIAVAGDGSGTWLSGLNLTGADLPNHASRHATGGPDPLPGNAVDSTMLDRSLTIATLASQVSSLANAWTDILTGVSVTTTGANQLVKFSGAMIVAETGGSNDARVGWRLREGSTTIIARPATWIPHGSATMIPLTGATTSLAAGAHTLKLQAWHGASGTVNVNVSESDSSETCSTQLEITVG